MNWFHMLILVFYNVWIMWTLNKPKTTGVFLVGNTSFTSQNFTIQNTHMRHIWGKPKVRMDGNKCVISLKMFRPIPFDHPYSLSCYAPWKLLQNRMNRLMNSRATSSLLWGVHPNKHRLKTFPGSYFFMFLSLCPSLCVFRNLLVLQRFYWERLWNGMRDVISCCYSHAEDAFLSRSYRFYHYLFLFLSPSIPATHSLAGLKCLSALLFSFERAITDVHIILYILLD